MKENKIIHSASDPFPYNCLFLFVEPLLSLFWASGDVCKGFQAKLDPHLQGIWFLKHLLISWWKYVHYRM